MSVQTWKRKLSSAEYLYQIYQLNIRLGEILVNKPQKYKTNYTDAMSLEQMRSLSETELHEVDSVLKRYSEILGADEME